MGRTERRAGYTRMESVRTLANARTASGQVKQTNRRPGPRAGGQSGGGYDHTPRSVKTSFNTVGRSEKIPSTPRSTRRSISARSFTVHT